MYDVTAIKALLNRFNALCDMDQNETVQDGMNYLINMLTTEVNRDKQGD